MIYGREKGQERQKAKRQSITERKCHFLQIDSFIVLPPDPPSYEVLQYPIAIQRHRRRICRICWGRGAVFWNRLLADGGIDFCVDRGNTEPLCLPFEISLGTNCLCAFLHFVASAGAATAPERVWLGEKRKKKGRTADRRVLLDKLTPSSLFS